MYKIYLVAYDLKQPHKNYEELYEEIRKYDSYWHYFNSLWLIYTIDTANTIYNKLHKYIDNTDYLLIFELNKDCQGWIPIEAWEWINSHI